MAEGVPLGVQALAVAGACCVHPFFDASFLHESALLCLEQLAEHVEGLVTERYADVCQLFSGHSCALDGVTLKERVALSPAAEGGEAWVADVPLRQVPRAEMILVILEQFFQAGARHVGEFDFRLTRCGCSLIAFGYVLLPELITFDIFSEEADWRLLM